MSSRHLKCYIFKILKTLYLLDVVMAVILTVREMDQNEVKLEVFIGLVILWGKTYNIY